MTDRRPGEPPGGESWAEARDRLLAHARRLTALRAHGDEGRPYSATERELEAICFVASVLIEEAGALPVSSRVAQECVRSAVALLGLAEEGAGGQPPIWRRPERKGDDPHNGTERRSDPELIEAEQKLRLVLQGRFALWEVRHDRTLRRVV